jgi:hypothetical protein
MTIINKKGLIIAIVLIIFQTGCAIRNQLPICEKDGRQYCTLNGAFRNRWHNFYEIGLSCMEGQCYSEALSFFDRAMAYRKEDRRMARKYGIHCIDYFPHRESGLIHYLMGDDILAEQHLKTSILQEPSTKAQHYLNKVRTRQLKMMQIMKGPVLSIPASVYLTCKNPVLITGTAYDPAYIRSLMIDDRNVFIESTEKQVQFQEIRYLKEGLHTVTITARNLLDIETRQPLDILVDRSGPVISIHNISDNSIEGLLSDSCQILYLSADGESVPLTPAKRISFNIHKMKLSGFIKLIAQDSLGNKTIAMVPLTDAARQVSLAQTMYAGPAPFDPLTSRSPFNIVIDNWTDGQTIYDMTLDIRGTVFSDARIAKISLDHTPFSHINDRMGFFHRTIPLRMGHNKIVVCVQDILGRQYRRTLHIHRKQSRAWDLDQRFCVKYNMFKGCKSLCQVFHQTFWAEMMRRKRFSIQGGNNLKALKNASDITQKAHACVKGSIYNSREGIEIAAQLIKNNSRILGNVDVFDEHHKKTSSQSMIKKLAIELCDKLHHQFPLIDGTIVSIQNNRIWMMPQQGRLNVKHVIIPWPVIKYNKLTWQNDRITGMTCTSGKKRRLIGIYPRSNMTFSIGDRIIFR